MLLQEKSSIKKSVSKQMCKKVKISFVFYFLASNIATLAQEKPPEDKTSNLDISVGVHSRYIWRGIQLGGNSPSVQPDISYTTGKFTFGAWGAYSTGGLNEFQEADLYICFSPVTALSFTITDYFLPEEGVYNNYFNHNSQTGHVFEALVTFNGTEKFPVSITVATNFAGAIKYSSNTEEKSSYSTYIEAGYSKDIGNINYNFFVGGVIVDDISYYLTNGSGLINLGLNVSKTIQITENFSFPLHGALIFNPDQENVYLTFGFTL